MLFSPNSRLLFIRVEKESKRRANSLSTECLGLVYILNGIGGTYTGKFMKSLIIQSISTRSHTFTGFRWLRRRSQIDSIIATFINFSKNHLRPPSQIHLIDLRKSSESCMCMCCCMGIGKVVSASNVTLVHCVGSEVIIIISRTHSHKQLFA